MSKEEFIRQRDSYRAQEDERMEQIQRLRTEKDQAFQPVKKDTDNLQAVMDTVGGAGDVIWPMKKRIKKNEKSSQHRSQNFLFSLLAEMASEAKM